MAVEELGASEASANQLPDRAYPEWSRQALSEQALELACASAEAEIKRLKAYQPGSHEEALWFATNAPSAISRNLGVANAGLSRAHSYVERLHECDLYVNERQIKRDELLATLPPPPPPPKPETAHMQNLRQRLALGSLDWEEFELLRARLVEKGLA